MESKNGFSTICCRYRNSWPECDLVTTFAALSSAEDTVAKWAWAQLQLMSADTLRSKLLKNILKSNSTLVMKINPLLTTKQQTTLHIITRIRRLVRRHGFSRPFFTTLASLLSFAFDPSDRFGRWPFALCRPAVQQGCQIHLWWLRCSEHELTELCVESLCGIKTHILEKNAVEWTLLSHLLWFPACPHYTY